MGETKALFVGAALAVFAVVICVYLTVLVEMQACTERTGEPCYLDVTIKRATP